MGGFNFICEADFIRVYSDFIAPCAISLKSLQMCGTIGVNEETVWLKTNLQIALKECYETEYWLELFVKSNILNREMAVDLYNQCGTIRRILIASINTAKENKDVKR